MGGGRGWGVDGVTKRGMRMMEDGEGGGGDSKTNGCVNGGRRG